MIDKISAIVFRLLIFFRLKSVINWGLIGEGVKVFDPHLSIFLKPENIILREHCRLDGLIKIEGGRGVEIGAYVHISSFAHINIGGGTVVINDCAAIASGAKILGGTNKPEGISMSAASPAEMQVVVRSMTTIEDCAFVGVNATIMPGVTIGRCAVIGAGAVVTKDVPPYEIWAGVPAQRIGRRESLLSQCL